ncbi:MAG: amino acid permease [Sphingobacteriales bacterium]|nr:MAG: amino acid permease [Sphingobacteriales bacterium]
MSQPHLRRDLNLLQATAINAIDMVGIGPFITLSGVAAIMGGSGSIYAWLLGALLSLADGTVWASLGAKWPEAGGSYVFLQKLFPRERGGRLMAFLFVWQTTLQAPLVVASAAIGFAGYFRYLVPLTTLQARFVAGGLVLTMIVLLYRDIKSIGRMSVVLGIITVGTLLWLIFSAVPSFDAAAAFPKSWSGFPTSTLFFAALGNATTSTVYSYLGYYNVCHLGGEIKQPEKNIPRAIFISIALIAVLYLAMQTAVAGVLPAAAIAESKFVVSLYFEKLYNAGVAKIATGLILVIALASLFSVLLGYSRIPYAAAKGGDYFPVFAKLHPTKNFPHLSLLTIGGIGFLLSIAFTEKPAAVIKAIVIMRILVQFIAQAVGLIRYRQLNPGAAMPWKMPLYPIPAILSILIWGFLFCTADFPFILGSVTVITAGIVLYFIFLHGRPSNPESTEAETGQ